MKKIIYELSKNEYGKVLPIFKELEHTLGDDAVIEGNRPGKIFVDNVTNPRTAFAWAKASEFYLAGYSDNDKFNLSLKNLIAGKITPEVMKQSIKFCVLHYSSDIWGNKINSILKNQSAWPSYRWLNTFKELRVDLKGISSSSCIERIDEKLLGRTTLQNIDRVIDHIIFKWGAVEKFMRKGFGFCLLREDRIASWCISANNVGKKCEITIVTDERYRNRGFATLTASALVEHCISKNLTPIWHCGSENLPSIEVAKKVGFEKTLLYPVYNWIPSIRAYLFWLMKTKPMTLVSNVIQKFRD